MNQEEAKNLYEGKYFYTLKHSQSEGIPFIALYGPLDNIYYIDKNSSQNPEIKITPKYAFCQVIDGQIKQVFLETEVLVLNYKL